MGDINIDLNENAIFESVAFNNIFEFLYEKWFKPGTKTDMLDCGKIAMYNLPYVINGSFACEIALKSAMSEDNAKKY